MSSKTPRRSLSHAEILDKIRNLHNDILQEAISLPDFLTTINSMALDKPDAYLAAVSAITSALVYGNDFSGKVPKLLAKSIAKLIDCESEVVRRSCLSILFLFSKTSQFQTLMNYLSDQFDNLNVRGQEMLLLFAFSFQKDTIYCFEPFVEHAEFTKNSSDDLLASASEDFLIFIENLRQDSDEEDLTVQPKAVVKARQSIDVPKLCAEEEEIEPYFDDEEEPRPAEYKLEFLDDNFDWENAEPPKSSMKVRNSIALKKGDVSFETSPEFSPRKLMDDPKPKMKPPRTAPPKPKRDTMELSMPSSDSPRKVVRKEEVMATTVSSPPRTMKPKTASRVRSVPTSSDDNLMSPKKKKAPAPPPVSELVEMMRDKDWEKQQKAVDTMSEIIASDPAQLATNCKEIWLNLIDLVSAARTTLANASLQFANALYEQFSQQLAPQTAQPIATLLTQSCSMHQFLADGASAVLLTIAEKSPRGRVLTPFLAGAKHKNPTGRARSVQCLAIICDSDSALEDKEFLNVIKAVAPLVRDTKSECREAVKRCLKVLADDERFWPVVRRVVPSSQEINDMKRMIE